MSLIRNCLVNRISHGNLSSPPIHSVMLLSCNFLLVSEALDHLRNIHSYLFFDRVTADMPGHPPQPLGRRGLVKLHRGPHWLTPSRASGFQIFCFCDPPSPTPTPSHLSCQFRVAITFSLKEAYVILKLVWFVFVAKSCPTLLQPIAHQAPLSVGFPRQEYRIPFPSPGDLPDLEIESSLLH